jgi:uncharacterized RDD family membrane protein YckC
MAENPEQAGENKPLEPASLSRRVLALVFDWILSLGISPLFGHDIFARTATGGRSTGFGNLLPLAIFFGELVILTSTIQSSAGQKFVGLRVVDDRDGSLVPFGRILLRSFLICLAIPPLITVNGRGLHDRVCHTVVVG